MINQEIQKIIENYGKDVTIATICSHSALQIFFGAKQEGFKTIGITTKKTKKVYESFPSATPDEFLEVNQWSDILDENFQKQLIEKNAIIIPHGSFVEYVGTENILEKFKVPMLGNRQSLFWESDRNRQREWFIKAGLNMPKQYKPNQINKLCIVKFSGAKGGRSFFKVRSTDEFNQRVKELLDDERMSKEDVKKATIQEYIDGARYYAHMFFSPISNTGWPVTVDNETVGRLELIGMDRRDEANIDDLHRTGLSYDELKEADIFPTYTVVGNTPIIIRESLLPKVFDIAEKIVKTSQKLFPPGIIGPFCLETFCRPNLEFLVFEISARIVAGVNLYPSGSPYTTYAYNEPISAGRRIAIEIKNAINQQKLKDVVL